MFTFDKECVLVVDDMEPQIDVLVETLAVNYNVSVCLDGETALHAVADNTPDLILLDIMMPDMDGYEVCKRLKANAATDNIPIIFISGREDQQSKIKALAMGGVDYICKPIHPSEVRARVETHLELAWMRRECEATLSQSLTGTIHLLSDLLAMMSPELSLFAARLHKGMKRQCRVHGLEPSWCYELAGMLMPLGMLPMSPALLATINSDIPLNGTLRQRLDESAAQSALLLARIPQFAKTVEIIRLSTRQPEALLDGQRWETLDKVKMAALIFRLVRESTPSPPELFASSIFIPSRLRELYGMPFTLSID